jgi:hypothetical protein
VLNRAGLGAAPVTAVLGVSLGVDIFAVIGGRGDNHISSIMALYILKVCK